MSLESGPKLNDHAVDAGERILLSEGDVEAAIAIKPYPAERYRAVREGRISGPEFIDDLIAHVRTDRARRIRIARRSTGFPSFPRIVWERAEYWLYP
jgi:hypothetical protein